MRGKTIYRALLPLTGSMTSDQKVGGSSPSGRVSQDVVVKSLTKLKDLPWYGLGELARQFLNLFCRKWRVAKKISAS